MTSAKLPQVRLQHMLENIDGVPAITRGRPIATIIEDVALIRATELAVQIISEAAKELPADLRDREPGIPWKNVIGIGNLLRHEYYRLDATVLDDILKTGLPTLRAAVLQLMEHLKA